MESQDSEDEDGNKLQKLPYDRKELNLEDFDNEFDALNPPIEIPDEVEDCIDNDFDLPYSPPDVVNND